MADFNEEFNELSPVQAMGRILRFIFTTNSAIWFEKDLTEELADYQAKLPIEIDITSTSQTIEWLKHQKQSWVVHPQEIATALEYNHCWPSVRNNGKINGCLKIGFRTVYVVDYNRVIEFPKRMAFIYDIYILDEYRGKGVAKYLVIESLKFLKAQGYSKVVLHIPPWNKVAFKVAEKFGFKRMSYIRCFRILGISILLVNPPRKIRMFKGNKILWEDILYE